MIRKRKAKANLRKRSALRRLVQRVELRQAQLTERYRALNRRGG